MRYFAFSVHCLFSFGVNGLAYQGCVGRFYSSMESPAATQSNPGCQENCARGWSEIGVASSRHAVSVMGSPFHADTPHGEVRSRETAVVMIIPA